MIWLALTNTRKRHELYRRQLVSCKHDCNTMTHGARSVYRVYSSQMLSRVDDRTRRTYVWAAVIWKMLSWCVRPPKKQLHPSTSKIFDRMEPSIDVWTMRSSSIPRNIRVNLCEYTTRTLEQSSNTDNHFDLARASAGIPNAEFGSYRVAEGRVQQRTQGLTDFHRKLIAPFSDCFLGTAYLTCSVASPKSFEWRNERLERQLNTIYTPEQEA